MIDHSFPLTALLTAQPDACDRHARQRLVPPAPASHGLTPATLVHRSAPGDLPTPRWPAAPLAPSGCPASASDPSPAARPRSPDPTPPRLASRGRAGPSTAASTGSPRWATTGTVRSAV